MPLRQLSLIALIAALTFTSIQQIAILSSDLGCTSDSSLEDVFSRQELTDLEIWKGRKVDLRFVSACANDDLYPYVLIKASPMVTLDEFPLNELRLSSSLTLQPAKFEGMPESDFLHVNTFIRCFGITRGMKSYVVAVVNDSDLNSTEMWLTLPEKATVTAPCHI